MNLFIRELRANRKALMIWSVCMFLLILSGMGKYSAYSTGPTGDVFGTLPDSLKALLGMGSFDVTSISGYFAMLFGYLELAAAVHAALLGSGIIAKEERDKTTEFLIVKPVSRSVIVTSKLLAALFNVAVVNLVTLGSCVGMVAAYNKGDDVSGEVAMFLLSMLLVQLIYLFLGSLMAALLRRSKAAGSLAAGGVTAGFVIAKITDLNSRLDILNLFSPFQYFSYEKIVSGGGLNILNVLLSLLLAALLAALTYVCYRRRDVNV